MARGQALQERLGAAPAAGERERAAAGRAFLAVHPVAPATPGAGCREPVLHLRGQPGCAASAAARAPCTGARDRAGGGGGDPREGARRGSWAPSLPSAVRLSAAQPAQGPGGALDQEEKVEGKAMWRDRCGKEQSPDHGVVLCWDLWGPLNKLDQNHRAI